MRLRFSTSSCLNLRLYSISILLVHINRHVTGQEKRPLLDSGGGERHIVVPLGVRHGANSAIQSGVKAQLFYLDFYSTTQKIPKQTGRDPGDVRANLFGR